VLLIVLLQATGAASARLCHASSQQNGVSSVRRASRQPAGVPISVNETGLVQRDVQFTDG
jgi:hypothetical protein